MIKEIKDNYKILNIISFGFCIFILIFPIVSKIMESISPILTLCPFLSITGKPCPICGGTRFIKGLPVAIANKNIKYMFNFFGIFVTIIFLEIVFRGINVFKKTYSDKIKNIDIIVHLLLVVMLIIYEIKYIINIL